MFNIQNTIIYCQHIIEHTVSNSNRFLVLDFSCEKVLLNGMMVSDFSVQSLSHVWLFATPWTAACQASLSITNSWNLLKLTSIELVMPSNHLILCRPLGLISFRVDWFDLLAVKGTLKSLLQHLSSEASIFRHSALWCNSHIHMWLLEKP